jgi:serine O-acetyltransferase
MSDAHTQPPVSPEELHRFKLLLFKLWVLRPERLWLLSIRLHQGGHWRLAFAVKQLNSLLFHNTLSQYAKVSPDIYLGHNGLGVGVSANVEIGSKVILWHNVMLTAGRSALAGTSDDSDGAAPKRVPGRIIVEDNVRMGGGAMVVAPRGRDLIIGRGARIGAGAIVTEDVPPRASVVGPASRVLPPREGPRAADPPPRAADAPPRAADVPPVSESDAAA